MKKLVALASAAVILAGCTSNSSESEEPPTSERGNILKSVGEQASFGSDQCGGNECFTFTVTKIEPSQPCEYPLNPAKGEPIAVHLSIDTTADATSEALLGTFQTYNWAVVDGDGTTHSNMNGDLMPPCDTDPNGIGGELQPNSHYEGVLNFDVPANSETLILNLIAQASWEWPISA